MTTPATKSATPALDALAARLETLAARAASGSAPASAYAIPGLWADPFGPADARNVEPAAFHLARIREILAAPPAPPPAAPDGGPGWARNAVVYNLLVRYGAAYDHNGDGRIDPSAPASGWRETGTFLKAIALLPYIRSLGCNAIHLLPVTAIGRDGNKGDMGSAFAIKDPYTLDPALGEPALGLGAEAEFAAFVEAAHRLGVRVVLEFVFRTAAKDAVWAKEHPEWFYWIRADVPDRRPGVPPTEDTYGAPLFTPDELKTIYDAVGQGRFGDLIPPHAAYRDMFTAPPDPRTVRLENGCWRGTAPDPRTGEPVAVRIPGAFCDWGPDSTQPPWTDVTYLRLYDHPDYNYIAYDTVRMYAARLATPENAVAPLWDRILGVVPYWHRRCRIDGVMLDMGHALPHPLKTALVARCRSLAPDFAFWEEEFNTTPELRAEGCDVCVGPFMQMARHPDWMHGWFDWISANGVPVPFMAMSENHNTPRAVHWPGGLAYARYAQTLGALLPGGVPYLHNGVELAETRPVNTGFDFTEEEQAALPPSRLPLFSAAALDWHRPNTLLPDLRRLHAVRAAHIDIFADPSPGTLTPVPFPDHPAILAFARHAPGLPGGFLVLANTDMQNPVPLPPLPGGVQPLDLLSDAPAPATLAPAQVLLLPRA